MYQKLRETVKILLRNWKFYSSAPETPGNVVTYQLYEEHEKCSGNSLTASLTHKTTVGVKKTTVYQVWTIYRPIESQLGRSCRGVLFLYRGGWETPLSSKEVLHSHPTRSEFKQTKYMKDSQKYVMRTHPRPSSRHPESIDTSFTYIGPETPEIGPQHPRNLQICSKTARSKKFSARNCCGWENSWRWNLLRRKFSLSDGLDSPSAAQEISRCNNTHSVALPLHYTIAAVPFQNTVSPSGFEIKSSRLLGSLAVLNRMIALPKIPVLEIKSFKNGTAEHYYYYTTTTRLHSFICYHSTARQRCHISSLHFF